MTDFTVDAGKDGEVRIEGVLDFNTVNLVKKQTIGLFNDSSDIQFDLSAVSQSNSAALALLLEWLKAAQKNHISLSFSNLPDHLRQLASVYGIEQDLNII
ncbi:MAG: STAS domain-containing protein [Gammaproteobacteria bacterium]|nr:STAS domain-containing protein [Gammaproteobacteria bacterium]